MKRTVLIVLGVVFLLFSAPLIVGGILVTSFAGDDPTIEGRVGEVRSPGYAVVSETVELDSDVPFLDRFDLTVGVRSLRADVPVFFGYGPVDSVDAYLEGAPHTVVRSVGRTDWTDQDVQVPGTAEPAPPGEQTFWLERTTGSGLQEIEIPSQSGDYRLVAMNADGSRGVDVAVYGSVTLAFTAPSR